MVVQKPKIMEATGGFINIMDASINILNNSKYFTAIMMLLMNLGARYISLELSQFHEELLSNVFVRRILVFTVVFISTRDIKVSLIFKRKLYYTKYLYSRNTIPYKIN